MPILELKYFRRKFKTYLNQVGQSILFWMFAMGLFTIFRYYGMVEIMDAFVKHKGFRFNLSLLGAVFIFSLVGMVFGFINATVEFIIEKFISKKMSLGTYRFLFIIVHVVSIVLIINCLVYILDSKFVLGLNFEADWWLHNKTLRTIILYSFLASVAFSCLKIINDKFGRGVFLKMLSGKYKEPKEEERIFMFLDLKSSTTLAEELGHFKYSQLIQDCIYDLNELIAKYSGDIYQYIGDEVVIVWRYDKGLMNNNCIELYFAFNQRLINKRNYYNSKYGVHPKFKAGLHAGRLMITEVGVIKKELAYHGDVINTSARIQSKCNEYQVPILISEFLLKLLPIKQFYHSTFIGNVLLSGKKEEVRIYTLKQP